MRQVRLGELTINRVQEAVSGLPFSMALPQIGGADLKRLRRWYWDETLSEDPQQAMFTLSVHSYVLQVDGLNILIDCCNGNDKLRSIPFANRLQTPYLENLAKLGLQAGDINIVMCTHLHADHVGWNTRLVDGRWVPTFPRARYVLGRRDYEFFSKQTHEVFHREAYLDSVLPVVEAGLAEIVDEDHVAHREVEDGVWMEPAFGHSPGSCVIRARRRGAPAVFSGDSFHHPIQLVRPDLGFFADEDQQLATATRLRLLGGFADSDTVIFPAHFAHTSVGRVKRDGDAFRYEFVES
jgi:glyoxylase-like metal-dependent hydrolase (beta-lactamase superfamily II)